MEIGDFGEINRCDLGDELEAAVVRRRPVYVELTGGEHFVDRPLDVVTEDGKDYVLFENRGRVAVGDLHAVAKAGPKVTAQPTDVPELMERADPDRAT